MSETEDWTDLSTQWKQKYYEGLAELERREQQWKEVETTLRRCISRLTLAADGRARSLDRQLEKLRNTVRSERNNQRLQELVERIVATGADLEAKGKKQGEPSPVEVLNRLTEAVPFPAEMARRVRSYRSRLERHGADEQLDRLVHDFAGLLRRALAEQSRANDASSGAPGPGWLRRLWSQGSNSEPRAPGAPEPPQSVEHQADAAPAQAAEPVSHALGDALTGLLRRIAGQTGAAASLEALERRAAAVDPGPELQALLDDIAATVIAAAPDEGVSAPASKSVEVAQAHEVLIQLLERLELPSHVSERVDRLKAAWEDGVAAADVGSAVAAVADLVADVRSRLEREKRDLENFLKQLTRRLEELDIQLQEGFDATRASVESSRELGAAVQVQVHDMQASVQEASDLDDLKTAVRCHLDAICDHMERFRSEEEKRTEEMEQHVRRLTNKLQVLEHESQHLRERMLEEHRQALCDPLTGVGNRLAYTERVAQEYERWRRYGSPLSLIVWDVDDFKVVNDRYGHKAGDKVLRTIAARLSSDLRTTDLLARYGGEEFVTLLPETPLPAAMRVAEKLREMISTCSFHYREIPVSITLSAGVSEFRTSDTPEIVFDRADQHLYRAKNSGKNRCCADEDVSRGA